MQSDIKNSDFHILVDAGGFSRGSDPRSLLLNQYLVKGLGWLNYSAINLGYREWSTRPTFLKKLEMEQQAPFLSANVYLKDSGKTVFPPYLIREIKTEKGTRRTPFKKLRIAVLGLTDNLMAQLFVNRPGEPVLEYRDPLEVARVLVPQIREEADLVILLYYGKYQKLQTILTEVPGIDVAVLGGESYLLNQQKSGHFRTIAVTSQSMGKYVGLLQLKMDRKKNILSSTVKQIPLDEKIEDALRFKQLVEEYETELGKPRP